MKILICVIKIINNSYYAMRIKSSKKKDVPQGKNCAYTSDRRN